MLLGIGLVFSDQITKYIIRHEGGFYICNSGAAFGIRIPLELFYLFWIIIIVGIVFFRKKYSQDNGLCVILILSGALSNVLDRFHFGCVIDFIDLRFWPVFNLADIYITVGALLLLARIKKG